MSIPVFSDAASDLVERHKSEEWMADYYVSAFFILFILAFALHPITKSL